MSYKLVFTEQGLKEWKKLDSSVGKIFKKKLGEILLNPRTSLRTNYLVTMAQDTKSS